MPHRSKGPESAVEDLIRLSQTLDNPSGLLPEHEDRLDTAFKMIFQGADNIKKRYYINVLQSARENIGDYAAALIAAGGSTAIIALKRRDREKFIEKLVDRKSEIKADRLRLISKRYTQKYSVLERNKHFFTQLILLLS